MIMGNFFSQNKNPGTFFSSSFFLGLTIGIPFCIFKILFGAIALRNGIAESNSALIVFGQIIILWAATDILMNAGRILLNIFHKKDYFEYCTIAQIGRIFELPAVFLALDTLLSFSIICFMLWSGWIMRFTTFESYLWYFATTLNLISISLVSLHTEVVRAKEKAGKKDFRY